jgi:hypothetical protein
MNFIIPRVGTGAQASPPHSVNAFGQAPVSTARILTLDTQEAAEERVSQYIDAERRAVSDQKKQNTIGE